MLAQSRQRTGGRNKGIDRLNNIHTWNSDLFGMVETGRVCVCGVLGGLYGIKGAEVGKVN